MSRSGNLVSSTRDLQPITTTNPLLSQTLTRFAQIWLPALNLNFILDSSSLAHFLDERMGADEPVTAGHTMSKGMNCAPHQSLNHSLKCITPHVVLYSRLHHGHHGGGLKP